MKVFLDAGHGGKDNGAGYNNLKEKDLTLDICKRIKSGLEQYENVEVLMSRETDIYLSLDERTQKANLNNCDCLLSVHINSAVNASANGFESYVYTNVPDSTKAFQNVLHNEIVKEMGAGIFDRGQKTANFHMVRESKMKALLTENLFIVNTADAAKLADSNFRQKIANGHINGIVYYYGLKKKQLQQKPAEEQKLYYVQVGAFEKKENAEALAADLSKEGYRPFIKYE